MGVEPKTAPDNMALWRAVEKTDPAHTKKVNQRGGFTAISAHYQVMKATEAFGPVGKGWGYENGPPLFHENLCIIPVTLWHGDRSNSFGPVYGSAEVKNSKGYLDADAPKKAATDGLTKGLSHLGFNADVFLGRFDDNKYIAEVTREFSGGQGQQGEVGPRKPAHSALKTSYRQFVHEANGCGDGDEWSAFMATADSIKLVNAVREKLPHIWDGTNWPEGQERPDEWEPLEDFINRRAKECALVTAEYMGN